MKTLKIFLIAFVATTMMITVWGQSAPQKKDKASLGNIFIRGSSIQKAVASGDYSFSKTTGTYSELTDAVTITNSQPWDDPEDSIPIGFTFKLYDLLLDTVYLGLGLGGLVSSPIDTNYHADYAVIPFETDLIDRGELSGISQSPIRYKLEGNAGNRILKIEWKNAGFLGEIAVSGTLNDYINFQLWLFEGSNDIEMHFGPNMITDPFINYVGETGAVAGVSDSDLADPYLLSGSPDNPVLSDTMAVLDGTPADGTIYRFSNLTAGKDDDQPEKVQVKIFPNPVQQVATVRICHGSLFPAELLLYDTFGRIVKTIRNIQTNEFSVDCNDMARGIYLYRLTDRGKFVATGKLAVE
jgi:hypothetical protein